MEEREDKARRVWPVWDAEWMGARIVEANRLWVGAIVVLGVAIWHARVDRTTRWPVVTWEGPLGSYGGWCLAVSLLLSWLALVFMSMACTHRHERWRKQRVVGVVLGIVDAVLTVGFLGELCDD